MGELVDRLVARIRAEAEITITRYQKLESVSSRAGTHRLGFAGENGPCEAEVAGQLVLGLSPAQLTTLNGGASAIDHTALGLCWAEVAEDDLIEESAFITIVDPALPAFRVSFGGNGAAKGMRLITIEFCGTVPRSDC